MLLGIVLHAALPYIPGAEAFWLTDENSSSVINIVFHFIHIWRMPLFFILAGFFAKLVISEKSWKHWWRNRLFRIGLPLMVFSPLLSFTLPAIFLYGTTGDFLFFYSNEGQPYHLWFLWHLIIFAVITGVFRPIYLLGSKVLSGLGTIQLRTLKHLFQNIGSICSGIIFQLRFPFVFIILCLFVNLPYDGELIVNPVGSGLYFILGYSLYMNHRLFNFIKSYWYYYFFFSMIFFCFYVIEYIPDERGIINDIYLTLTLINLGEKHSLFDGLQYLSKITCGVLFSYGFIGLAENRFGSYHSKLKFVSDGAYWMYLIHLPIVTFITFSMFDLRIPIEIKFLISIAMTSVICLGTYKYFVRSTGIGLLLNGKRHPFKPMEL